MCVRVKTVTAALAGGTTERVSVGPRGRRGNSPSADAAISADDRFVAFQSEVSNLMAGDTNRTVPLR